MRGADIEPAPLVDLMSPDSQSSDALEVELATTLLYGHCHYSYRQLRNTIEATGQARRREVIDLGLRHRGRHDEMPRSFSAGQQFCFDILMDIGGFRDMHRHRRCVQIMQDFTTIHGFDTPPEVEAAGVRSDYESAMKGVDAAVQKLAASGSEEAAQSAQYAIPLAFRKRTLFKMDFAEAAYQMAALELAHGRALEARNRVDKFVQQFPPSPELLMVGLRAARTLGDARGVAQFAKILRADFPNSEQARSLNTEVQSNPG